MTLEYLTEMPLAPSVLLRSWDTQSCTCDSSVNLFFQDPLLPRRMLVLDESLLVLEMGKQQLMCDTPFCPHAMLGSRDPHYHAIVTDEKAVPQ